MLFWVAASVLTFIALLFVLLPLARKEVQAIDSVEYDKAMFKARQQEIERDLALGRISQDAARAALAEEGRKLIALAEAERHPLTATGSAAVRLVAVAAMIAVPLLALGGYFYAGNPGMPDQRLAARRAADPQTQSIQELVARAEAHLSANPEDARGWSVLAPIYSRLGRNEDAVRAWANVYRLAPDTQGVRASLAESHVAAADGVVTEQARKLFEEELAVNRHSAKARFYLAIAKGQEGRHDEAVALWDELIAGGTSDAPWMEAARAFRAESARLSGDVGQVAPGPTREQVEDAAAMSAADRAEMIRGMIEGLATRLADDPSDKDGWKRLVRAYMVLGETDKLREAVDAAVAAHGDDQDFVSQMRNITAGASEGSSSQDGQTNGSIEQ